MKKREYHRSRGQISILIALLIATFLSLLGFVVNTGLLINAKINVQNAADLAAYAGAASQARVMNQVSYLNYEMRRQVKKFLFRYYVIGNMAQETHLSDPPGEARSWAPRPGAPSYDVPAVCIIFNRRDNFCQVPQTNPIEPIPTNPLDSIGSVLNQQLEALEAIRRQNCAGIGSANQQTLLYWLYNTDPNLEVLEEQIRQFGGSQDPRNQEIANILSTLKGLATGIGLVPRETLLLQRIKTLEFYLNAPQQTRVDLAKLNELEQEPDPAYRERTIQAFLSAFNTLGEYLYDNDSIELDELQPDTLFRVDPLESNFEAYFIKLDDSGGNSAVPAQPGACVGTPAPVFVRNVPVGVQKDPTLLTYYAVRLKADVRLPFWPFGPVTLKAYSAAQPFGSRIGPPEELVSLGDAPPFVWPDRKSSAQGLCPRCEGIPNLPMEEGDGLTRGWNQVDLIRTMFGEFQSAGGSIAQVLGARELEKAYHSAMAPNPPEKGLYNIINDLNAPPGDPTHSLRGDPFVRYFDDERNHAFWAPIASPSQVGSAGGIDAVLQSIQQNLPASMPPAVRSALTDSVRIYLDQIRNGAGENGEGFQVVRLEDPNQRPASGNDSGQPRINGRYLMNQVEDLKTSWNDVDRRDFRDRGRNGYSVKFVSFDTLLSREGVTTDGSRSWTNGLDLDAEAEGDVPLIQH